MGNVRAIPFAGLAFCGATVKSAIREDCFRDKTMPAKHVTESMEKIIYDLLFAFQHVQ